MRISTPLLHLFNAFALFTAASGWNYDVHNQIGFMAEEFTTAAANVMVQVILGSEYDGSIGRAAHWADTVSKTTHRYSYGWHWISAADNPPHYCNVYYSRDCQEGGCSVSQIQNQTFILQDCIRRVVDGNLTRDDPDVNCQQALKWLVHFIGDTAQPTHNSGRDFGGNLFKVTFNGTETNMHQTWDRHIIYAMLGFTSVPGFSQTELSPFGKSLVERIRADALPVARADMLVCADTARPAACALRWARDSNALTCDFAYGRYVNGSDLWRDNGYAEAAFPLIEVQLAKAALRLAAWLNVLAAQGLEDPWAEADAWGAPGDRAAHEALADRFAEMEL